MARVMFGSLEIPEHWDVRTQLELREPASALEGPKTAKQKTVARPGANVVIRRFPSSQKTLEACAAQLLGELKNAAPAFKHEPPKPVTFADGVAGLQLNVSFDVSPQVRAHQCHVFRLDGEIATHLCGTADAGARLSTVLPLLLSFSPS